jgi:hypothetical protein
LILAFAPATTPFLWPEFRLPGGVSSARGSIARGPAASARWVPLDRLVHGPGTRTPCPGGACPLRRAGRDGWTLDPRWVVADEGTFRSPAAYFADPARRPTVFGWRRLAWPLVRRFLTRRLRAAA